MEGTVNKRRAAFVLLLCLVLGGCATQLFVEPPETEPSAVLTLKLLGPVIPTDVFVRDCSRGASLLVTLGEAATSVERRIPVDRPFKLYSLIGNNTASCKSPVIQFEPRNGGRYEAVFKTSGGTCSIGLNHVVGEGAARKVENEPSVSRAPDYCGVFN